MPRSSASSGSATRETSGKQKPSQATDSSSKRRQIAQPTYKSFRMSKRIRHKRHKVLGSFRLFKKSIKTLLKRKKLFFGIVVVYLVLTIALVKGFSVSSGIDELKDTLLDLAGGGFSRLTTGLALFSVLLSNIGSNNGGQASGYQTILLITVSLALIWALRQTLSPESKKRKLTAKDAFYNGQYPLIPFLLVLVAIGLQLLPVAVANFLFTTVIAGGLAITAAEKVLWFAIIGLLILLSLYMITSSIFALYIVTLPDVSPMQALRSARELVRYRRWTIMRKVLFLPVALLVISAVVIVPVIMVSPTVAEWLFFVLGMMGLAVFHSYLYTLYRELL